MNTKVLTKAILVNHINESIGLSKRECKIFLETFLEKSKIDKNQNFSENVQTLLQASERI